MYGYIYIYICIYIYPCIYIYVDKHVYIYICMYTYIHIYIYLCMYIYLCVYIYTCLHAHIGPGIWHLNTAEKEPYPFVPFEIPSHEQDRKQPRSTLSMNIFHDVLVFLKTTEIDIDAYI